MKLLYDATLPHSLSVEAPQGVKLDRWKDTDSADVEIVQAAAARRYQGVIFLGRDSLYQLGIRNTAAEHSIALVAVEAQDPIEGKQRLLRNLPELTAALLDGGCVVVTANSVRSL